MTDRLLTSAASTLRLVSLAACLVVVLSFILFAVDRTGTAARGQAAQIQADGPPPAAGATAAPATPVAAHDNNSARHTLDTVAREVESPFHGLFAGTSSAWAIRGGELICVLVVYGLGAGFIARLVRVHA